MTSTFITRGVTAAIVGAAAVAVALTSATAAQAAAFGTDVDTVVTVKPGDSARVPATILVSEAYPAFNGFTITFNAPANTTFPAQTSVPAEVSQDGKTYSSSSLVVDGCVAGAGGTTLTCHGPTIAFNWYAPSYRRFNPLVTVNANAPKNQQLTSNNAASLVQSGVTYTANTTLKIKTPAAIPVAVNGAANGGVVTTSTPAIAGTGDAGSVVTVTSGSGTPYCTATVAAGGAWSCTGTTALPDGAVTFLASQRNTDGSVTTAQATRTIATVAATPIIAPAGLMAAALIALGAGAVVARRRSAGRRAARA